MTSSGSTRSAWMEADPGLSRPPLREGVSADVCIIGAGIAGLSIAYALSERGASVVVLEKGQMGCGETERTTAHLSCALATRYEELARMHGQEGAAHILEAHMSAVDFIEQTVKKEQIDCDFHRTDGYLFGTEDDPEDLLEKETKALHTAGFTDAKLLKESPMPFFDFGKTIIFPRQGQFHPLQYLKGIAKAAEKAGTKIFCDSHVSKLEGGENASAKTKEGHTVRAKTLVVATNAPINDNAMIYTKQAPYRTFVVSAAIPKNSVPPVLLWDTNDPYHYVRTFSPKDSPTDVLIVGGEDHKTGQADDAPLRYQRLETWMRKRFPMAGDIQRRWSGQVQESSDGIAMIGHMPLQKDNVFIVTGDSGNGITHGTFSALLLPDLIEGKKNIFEKTFSPSRHSRGLKEFVREGLNVAACFVERFTGGDSKDALRIALDSGTVIRRGTTKIAVYRDTKGETHEFSAICPHKGCVVHWNSGEQSWDCPCHGSRFGKEGEVLTGPTRAGLKPITQQETKK